METRANEWDEMQKIMNRADEEKRDLLAEENEQVQRATDSIGNLDERIEQLTDLHEANKRAADQRAEFERTLPDGSGPANQRPSYAEQFRQLASKQIDEVVIDLRGLYPDYDRNTGLVHVRDLTTALDADIVPVSFVRRLYEHLVESSAIRRTNVTVLTTTSGEALELPKTNALQTAQLTAEGVTIVENDPSFAKITLNSYKFTNAVQITPELLADSGVDVEGFIARDMGRAIADDMGEDFIVGDGTAKPNGVSTASVLAKTGGTGVGGLFTADDLIDVFYAVIEQYANRGTWMMRRATEGEARKLKGSDNNYLWQPGLQVGSPNLLLGQPVVNDPFMAAVGLSAVSVLFGDFSTYVIRDVGSVSIKRSDDFAFLDDLVTFKGTWRSDGDQLDTTGAIKHFVGGAT